MVCANFSYINICISCYLRVETILWSLSGLAHDCRTLHNQVCYAVDCACNKNGQQKLSVKVAGGGLEAEARGDTFWRRQYVEQ